MKRFFITISAFVVALFVIYSGLWFYQSKKVKTLAEAYVNEITKKFGGEKSEFTYADSSVGGFPLSFKVEFAKPKFSINDTGLAGVASSDGSVVLNSNVIGSKFTVLLPKEVSLTKVAEEKPSLLVKFNEEPSILVRGKQKGLVPWIINAAANNIEDMPWVVTEFAYEDKGWNISRVEDGAVFSLVKSASLDFKMGDSDTNYSLTADFKNMQLDKLIQLPEYADMLGNLNIKADMAYKEAAGEADASVEVKEFSAVSDGFAVDISGNLERSNTDALPFGLMRVKIGQYENFVNYNVALINYVVANSAFPIFNIKDKQIDSTKEFLRSIASEKYNDDKDILILLNRKKGEDFRIGQMGFYEALQRFKLGVNGADSGNKNATKVVLPNAM